MIRISDFCPSPSVILLVKPSHNCKNSPLIEEDAYVTSSEESKDTSFWKDFREPNRMSASSINRIQGDNFLANENKLSIIFSDSPNHILLIEDLLWSWLSKRKHTTEQREKQHSIPWQSPWQSWFCQFQEVLQPIFFKRIAPYHIIRFLLVILTNCQHERTLVAAMATEPYSMDDRGAFLIIKYSYFLFHIIQTTNVIKTTIHLFW